MVNETVLILTDENQEMFLPAVVFYKEVNS